MTSINQNYSMLDDPLVNSASGLTNIYETARNDLFPKNNGGEYRRVEEQQVPPDHVYCTFRDIEPTAVMLVLFSKANIDYLQQEMINQVYQKSCGNFRISRQSTDEILIILRSMYLQYSRNLPFDIEGQVAELNKQFLLYAVPNILTRAQGYLGYMRDQITPNKFIANPNYISSAGTRIAGDFSTLII